MNPIGPNGYNFSDLIPNNYTGTVWYMFTPYVETPVGYFQNGVYVVAYGHIAGCPSTGPTGPPPPLQINGMSGHPGPSGPPNQRMY
jgi:hypothetical protein